MELHQDFTDLLAAFVACDVRFLVIGGYAVAFHGRPRFTKDIDLWLEDTPENLKRLHRALDAFGAPPHVLDLVWEAKPDEIVYLGAPPARVDLFRQVPGLAFADAYANRAETTWGGVSIGILGRADLIRAKKATGRPIDLADVADLGDPTTDLGDPTTSDERPAERRP